jgi:hypothetical protein
LCSLRSEHSTSFQFVPYFTALPCAFLSTHTFCLNIARISQGCQVSDARWVTELNDSEGFYLLKQIISGLDWQIIRSWGYSAIWIFLDPKSFFF